jgi:putative ABC transport system ATP-binding protein
MSSPTAGKVKIGGADVTRKPTASRAGRVARVFQDPLAGSCGALTIEENLALAASSRRASRFVAGAWAQRRRDFFKERIASLNLGLENRLKRPYGPVVRWAKTGGLARHGDAFRLGCAVAG